MGRRLGGDSATFHLLEVHLALLALRLLLHDEVDVLPPALCTVLEVFAAQLAKPTFAPQSCSKFRTIRLKLVLAPDLRFVMLLAAH